MTKRELLEALEGMQELVRWQGHVLSAAISALQRDLSRSGRKSASSRDTQTSQDEQGD